MKKEVQALVNRRRARLVAPALFGGLALLVVLGIVLLAVSFFSGGPGQSLLRTATPTASMTPSPVPPTPTSSLTPTPDLSPTPSLTPGPSPTPAPITYTVQSGDTLFGIAAQFDVDLCEMLAANQISNPALVGVGTVITVPLGGLDLPTPTPIPTGLGRGARIKVVVQCGDSLQSIASQFASTAEDIAKLNKITDAANIPVGLVLDVRIGIATPTPVPAAATATP